MNTGMVIALIAIVVIVVFSLVWFLVIKKDDKKDDDDKKDNGKDDGKDVKKDPWPFKPVQKDHCHPGNMKDNDGGCNEQCWPHGFKFYLDSIGACTNDGSKTK